MRDFQQAVVLWVMYVVSMIMHPIKYYKHQQKVKELNEWLDNGRRN